MLVRLTLRVFGMVIGIIGALLAFIITLVHFTMKAIEVQAIGSGHTPTGLAMSGLALIGALIAVPFPVVSAIAMLIAGAVMLYVAGALGAAPLIVLAVAALLVFLDRGRRKATERA